MLKKLRAKLRKLLHQTKQLFQDPPLDIIGAGVLGSLVGRCALYGGFAISYGMIGQPLLSGLFMAVIATDIIIHLEVLAAFRKMMRHEIERELAQYGLFYALPG